jgi:hypothetical protein
MIGEKFAESQGFEYAMVPLKAEEILVLHEQLAVAEKCEENRS